MHCQESDTTDDKCGPFAPSTTHYVLKGFPVLRPSSWQWKEAPKDFPIRSSLIKRWSLTGLGKKRWETSIYCTASFAAVAAEKNRSTWRKNHRTEFKATYLAYTISTDDIGSRGCCFHWSLSFSISPKTPNRHYTFVWLVATLRDGVDLVDEQDTRRRRGGFVEQLSKPTFRFAGNSGNYFGRRELEDRQLQLAWRERWRGQGSRCRANGAWVPKVQVIYATLTIILLDFLFAHMNLIAQEPIL